MKRSIRLLVAATALVPIFYATARAEKLEDVNISSGVPLSTTTTKSIDVSRYANFSVQATYADGTASTHTISDGIKSTATITVSNASLLVSTQASVQIFVSTPLVTSGDTITLAGVVFSGWTAVTSTATTATNIATLISAHRYFSAFAQGSTVTVRYVTFGVTGNGLTASAGGTGGTRVSASTFSGGVNRYSITLNGITFTEGIDFKAGLSSGTAISSMTAAVLVSTINANTTLAAQVVASTPIASGTRVDITALTSGSNGYYVSATTTAFATTNFTVGAPPEFDINTDVFTKANHGLVTGEKVQFSSAAATAGSSITGLFGGTTYYAIRLNDTQYALNDTSTGAVAGAKLNITGNTGANTTFSMFPVPLSLAAGNGFFWKVSNDNVNFSTFTFNSLNNSVNIASVTYAASGSTMWDFGTFTAHYLQLNFVGPTSGAIALQIRMFGKRD